MMKATILTALLLTLTVATSAAELQVGGASRSPNVLFITSDDLGRQLGCCGDTVIKTPKTTPLPPF